MIATWRIDPVTLREVVDDPAALEELLDSGAPGDRVWALRVLGRLDDARREGEALIASDGGFRALLLFADVLSVKGEFTAASALQERATALADTPARQALALQHTGKRLFDEKRYAEAAERFRSALALRERHGAAAEAIASSRFALARAESLLAD